MKLAQFAFAATAALPALVSAYTEVRVLQPSTLADEFTDGLIDNTAAMFGTPSYARPIVGSVRYAEDQNDEDNPDGCQSLEPIDDWPAEGLRIIMAKRGNCNFVTKVRHIQEAYGALAIIWDDRDEPNLPYMADDGTGHDIRIPAILIRHSSGESIKAALDDPEGGVVMLHVEWGIPHPSGNVHWDLWTSSNDPKSRQMKMNFHTVVEHLGDRAIFTPYEYIIDGSAVGCAGSVHRCGSQCTNEGRYCAVDPDMDLSSGVSGADIIRENTRQACVTKVITDTEENTLKWWAYQKGFITNCCNPATPDEPCHATTFKSASCVSTVMAEAGIDEAAVQACIDAAEQDDGTNTVLEELISLRSEHGVFWFPQLVVNHDPYEGKLDCQEYSQYTCGPYEAICAGFPTTDLPDACKGDAPCSPGETMDLCGECGGENTRCADCLGTPYGSALTDSCGVCDGDGSSCRGVTVPQLILIITICVFFLAGGVFVYIKRQQNQVRDDIDSLLKQYLPLEDANDISASGNLLNTEPSDI